MASYEYEYYICPACKARAKAKKCFDCKVPTKGQGKVSLRFRLVENGYKRNKRTLWYPTKREAEEEYLKVKSTAPAVDLRFKDGTSYKFEDLLQKISCRECAWHKAKYAVR